MRSTCQFLRIGKIQVQSAWFPNWHIQRSGSIGHWMCHFKNNLHYKNVTQLLLEMGLLYSVCCRPTCRHPGLPRKGVSFHHFAISTTVNHSVTPLKRTYWASNMPQEYSFPPFFYEQPCQLSEFQEHLSVGDQPESFLTPSLHSAAHVPLGSSGPVVNRVAPGQSLGPVQIDSAFVIFPDGRVLSTSWACPPHPRPYHIQGSSRLCAFSACVLEAEMRTSGP